MTNMLIPYMLIFIFSPLLSLLNCKKISQHGGKNITLLDTHLLKQTISKEAQEKKGLSLIASRTVYLTSEFDSLNSKEVPRKGYKKLAKRSNDNNDLDESFPLFHDKINISQVIESGTVKVVVESGLPASAADNFPVEHRDNFNQNEVVAKTENVSLISNRKMGDEENDLFSSTTVEAVETTTKQLSMSHKRARKTKQRTTKQIFIRSTYAVNPNRGATVVDQSEDHKRSQNDHGTKTPKATSTGATIVTETESTKLSTKSNRARTTLSEDDQNTIVQVNGIWIGGRCRCDYLIRSSACRLQENLLYALAFSFIVVKLWSK